jgi:hypothetical protein
MTTFWVDTVRFGMMTFCVVWEKYRGFFAFLPQRASSPEPRSAQDDGMIFEGGKRRTAETIAISAVLK